MKRRTTVFITLSATAGLFLGACSDDKDKAGSSGDFCTLARAYDTASSETDNVFGGSGSVDDVKKAFSEIEKQIGGMVGAAPAEIKKDTQTLQSGLKTFNEVLKSVDYDLTKLFSDPDAAAKLAVLDTPEFTKASENVDAYLGGTCGIDTSS